MNQSDNALKNNQTREEVKTYWGFCEGTYEPSSGKTIKKLIMNSRDYIVFLDEKLCLQWEVTNQYSGDYELFKVVMPRVAELEGLSNTFNLPEHQLIEFKTLLGTAIVMMLEEEDEPIARKLLNKANTYLKARMTERARMWCLLSSSCVVLLALISILLLWIFKTDITNRFGTTAFDVVLGTQMGAIGALISIITRSNKMLVNVSAGKTIHYLEGTARIIVGMLGALLVALAIKANIFFGMINSSENTLAVLLTVCTVAGASERIVPSIIKQVEGIVEKQDDEVNLQSKDSKVETDQNPNDRVTSSGSPDQVGQ